MNRGNAGHRGYKMAKIAAMSADETAVLIHLDCGHVQRWKPYSSMTPQAWLAHITAGSKTIRVGDRLRCNKQHK